MGFGDEVESGDVGIRDMGEGDVLGGRIIEGVNIFMEDLGCCMDSVIREKTVSGSIGQLSMASAR